jgi:hypothetical protein
VYEPYCGLRKVHMSWGHDEYVYHMVKDHLPEEGLYMLRYHSFTHGIARLLTITCWMTMIVKCWNG